MLVLKFELALVDPLLREGFLLFDQLSELFELVSHFLFEDSLCHLPVLL